MRHLIVPICATLLIGCISCLQLLAQAGGQLVLGQVLAVTVGSALAAVVWSWWAYHRAILKAISAQNGQHPRDGWLACLVAGPIRLIEKGRSQAAQLMDLLEQAKLRVQLLEQKARQIEAILDSIKDAVVVVGRDSKVVLANKAALEMFEADAEACNTCSLDRWFGQDHGDMLGIVHQVCSGRNEPARVELRWPGADGDRFYDCVVCCVRDQKGQPCGAVVMLHDITRDKDLARAKDDFIGYVSHEFKTPLASIIAYAEMLLDDEVADDLTRQQYLQVILDQAARLNRLVENMLSTSRIESGLISVKKQALSLAMLVEEHVKAISSYANERGIRVDGQRPIVYDQVIADKDLIGMAIINLLSNAIKYNSPGGLVTVRTEVDEVHSVVRLTVTDTGVGIPPEQQQRLFEKFYRAPANANRAEGTGLGLNLVKQIVERVHGGKVFFSSTVGAGSTFGFELPLATKACHVAAAG
ncbi:MAG: ATP-binding protein [Sedimentisphaerales bacterium]|nr:ATP-binding protein [Sedimentisphaerales bacterium]